MTCKKKSHWLQVSRQNYWEINQVTSKCQIDFWAKLAKKSKIEHHDNILHIQISIGTKFDLKLTLLNFWTKLMQKEYFQSKKYLRFIKSIKKYHQILNIQINLGSKFHLQQTILSFEKFPKKRIFPVKNRKK